MGLMPFPGQQSTYASHLISKLASMSISHLLCLFPQGLATANSLDPPTQKFRLGDARRYIVIHSDGGPDAVSTGAGDTGIPTGCTCIEQKPNNLKVAQFFVIISDDR
jgi:hypothetical protein